MKCSICEKQVKPEEEFDYKAPSWFINAAVVGASMEIYGHKTCLRNVDDIVITNRIRLLSNNFQFPLAVFKKLKKKVKK